VRSSVILLDLYRDGEVVSTGIFNLLPLDVVALSSCEGDPGTDLGGGLVEPIVAPMNPTVAIGNPGWVWRYVGISIVGVFCVQIKLAHIITRCIEAVLGRCWSFEPAFKDLARPVVSC